MTRIRFLLATLGLFALLASPLSAQTTSAVATTIIHAQVATSTTATLVAPQGLKQRNVLVRNHDTTIPVYVGNSAVTTANGVLLKAGEAITFYCSAPIYAVAASGTPTVSYLSERNE